MNGADDVYPLSLTPATRSVGSSAGGSPQSNNSKSVLSAGRLMMSGGTELEVQYFDNSKLRAAVEELSELTRTVQQERDDLLDQLQERDNTIITLRCGDVPKLELSQMRQMLSSLKSELSESKQETQSLTAQTNSLISELRKQTQTVIAKDTLLKARARSISSYQQQVDELRTQLRVFDESGRSDRHTLTTKNIQADDYLQKIQEQATLINNLQRECEESAHRERQQQDLVGDLRSELESAQDRLRHFTADSVDQQLFSGFDAAIEMSEKNQRDLQISLREANATIRSLRAEVASKKMSSDGNELDKCEERCRAVIQVAKQSKLKQLYAEVMNDRKDILLEQSEEELQLSELMRDERLLMLLSDLKLTFDRSKKAFHNRILSELKPLTDDAYLRGHAAAVKKFKRPPDSTTTTSSNIFSANSSTDLTNASLDEQLTLFEIVLKKASAKQVAQCLLRCGLKVASVTPNTTVNSED